MFDEKSKIPKENATVVEFRTLFPGVEFTYDECVDYLNSMREGRYPEYICECNKGYTRIDTPSNAFCCLIGNECGKDACCSEEEPICYTNLVGQGNVVR